MNGKEAERIKHVYAARDPWMNGNLGRIMMIRERNEALRHILKEQRPLNTCRILDVGCGYGDLLQWLYQHGTPAQHLYGIDLIPERIATAQHTYPHLHFKECNAEMLPYESHQFDFVLTFTLFSSILDHQVAKQVAHECVRMLKQTGAIIWYDIRYRNPKNPNVRAMPVNIIRELFPGFELELVTVTLLPPLAYRLSFTTPWLYPALSRLPMLRSHYVGLLWPKL